MTTHLSRTRDELLPMVWSAQTENVVLNIYIEERFDAIIVAGRNDKKNAELGFAITAKAIIDGTYRTQVASSLRTLVHLLEEFEQPPPFSESNQSWRIH